MCLVIWFYEAEFNIGHRAKSQAGSQGGAIGGVQVPLGKSGPTRAFLLLPLKRGQRNPRSIAGNGNRTRMASLEGWNFTIKLCPHLEAGINLVEVARKAKRF